MLSSPPMFPTNYQPEDIIGISNMDTFRKHYMISVSQANGGEFPDKRLDKEIGKASRVAIAETYIHLREHGFYPNGLNPDTSIRWGIMVKSKSQVMMEKGLNQLKGLPMGELQEKARAGWKPLVDSVEVKSVEVF